MFDDVDKEILLVMATERLQGPMRQANLDDPALMERGLSCGFRFEAGTFVAHLKWVREKKHYIFNLEVFALDPSQTQEVLMHVPVVGGLSKRKRRTRLPELHMVVTRSFDQEVK